MARSSPASKLTRVRIALLAFFCALAAPTFVLVKQGFSQLELDAFRQHQLSAEALVADMDASLREAILREDARSFADYGFLVLVGEIEANFLQRSELSALPVRGPMPGVLGYFQIDADGVFSTPLLPDDSIDPADYGIGAAERDERAALQAQIRAVLAENRVVQARTEPGRPAPRLRAELLEEVVAGASSEGAPDVDVSSEAGAAAADNRGAASEDGDSSAAAPGRLSSVADLAAGAANAPALAAGDDLGADAVAGQAVFDQLAQEANVAEAARAQAPAASVLVSGLQDTVEQTAIRTARTEQAVVPQSVRENRAERFEAETAADAEPRRELDALAPRDDTAEAKDADDETPQRDYRIDIFSSELEPFAFGLLDTGHFVLFRNAWRDGQRFVQGALLEQAPFVESVVARAFAATGLASDTRLGLNYAGRPLAGFGTTTAATALHRARLSPPFAELELEFAVGELDLGPGYPLLVWLSVVLSTVLTVGFVLLYRFSAKQIELARQQQDFVAAVSHELKTPLTSIRMYGEMLKAGWTNEAKKASYYDFIYQESERLSRLIENVLQLARMTRREVELDLAAHTAAELLDLARSKVASQLEHAGFDLRVACEDDVRALAVLVDTDSFAQIAINLVDNAVKFSAQAIDKAVEIGVRRARGGRVAFTVRDFGPGVPRAKMRKLFELFYRPDNALTRATAGTGIGLALVKQLAEAMHAKVDVRNREPGAEFVVSFPSADRAGQG